MLKVKPCLDGFAGISTVSLYGGVLLNLNDLRRRNDVLFPRYQKGGLGEFS